VNASDRLRIGDQEREAATAALGEHYSTGRLTRDELEERSRLALEARTLADLRPLFADVPLPHGPLHTGRTSATGSAAPGSVPGVWLTPARRRGPRFPWGPVVVALVALTVITDRPWIWVGLLAWAAWAMLSPRRREERRARRARRDARRDALLNSWHSTWTSGWHDGGRAGWNNSWSNSWSGACGHGGAHPQESRGSWSHRS
jgi:hypothetical protein